MPNFSPELFIQTLARHNSTVLYIVPPLGEYICIKVYKWKLNDVSLVLMLTYHDAVKKEYLQYVNAILSGGAPFAASDEKAFINKFGDKIYFLQGEPNLLLKSTNLRLLCTFQF